MNCVCKIDLVPLGSPRCSFDFNIVRGVIFFDASVVNNPINFDNTTGLLNISGLIDDGLAVSSPKFFDVTLEKEASVTQSFGDGTTFFIRDGIRTFSGTLAKPTPSQVGSFKKFRCKKVAVYLVDNNGNLLGYVKDPDKLAINNQYLYPIPIESGTVDAILDFATDSTVRQSKITFQFSNLVSDEQFRGAKFTPSDFILDLIENPAVGLLVPTGTPFSNINLTLSTASLAFYYQNGEFSDSYLTIEDFTSPIVLSGTNISTNTPFTISLTPSTIFGALIQFNITIVAGVTSGDTISVEKVTGVNAPFRALLVKPETFVVL